MGVDRPWKVAWITGASSGIGRELALQLARAGVNVAASARSKEKLDELTALSKNIRSFPLDVTEPHDCVAVFEQIERDLGPVNLAVLSAGIWQQMTVSDYSVERARQSMDVNYFGVVNVLEPVMSAFARRGEGHIGVVSSVAGFRGLLKGAAYAPTKAALIAMSEALYPHLTRKGVAYTIINPGFVKTPMTDVNTFPMPFIIDVEDAARLIISGLEKRKYEIVFPWKMALLMKTLRALPNWAFFRLVNIGINRAGTGETPPPGTDP